jgi:nicotinamide phosphoribosyltransferase
VSLVSDSFDFWSALQNFMPRLKDKIMARNGRVVLRPDSGVPELILCGDPEAPEGSPARRGAIDILGEVFGYTVNDKGYKELDPHIGLIYGDGITHERAESIVKNMMSQGWASTNVVFGFGSYTFQYQSRDTFMMAMRNIFKDPITDNGDKKSARGRLAVRRQMNGIPYLIQEATPEQENNQDMEVVFNDGVITRHQSFADVRAQLKRDTEVLERTRVPEPEKVAI